MALMSQNFQPLRKETTVKIWMSQNLLFLHFLATHHRERCLCTIESRSPLEIIMAQVKFDLEQYLPLIASGKVRELYEVDAKTLLFVATDRISAYDVIMKNVSVTWLTPGSQLITQKLQFQHGSLGHPQRRVPYFSPLQGCNALRWWRSTHVSRTTGLDLGGSHGRK